MHMRTLPLIPPPHLMPHGSGYIPTGGILGLPRGSDSGTVVWGRHCGFIILESVLDIVVSASQIVIKISLPRGSAGMGSGTSANSLKEWPEAEIGIGARYPNVVNRCHFGGSRGRKPWKTL